MATGCDIQGDSCDVSSIGWPGALLCMVIVVALAAVAIAFFRS
jgi:hypothetical protein